ncbi:bifunctional RNase H/acid phosphatase [Buchananella hordeovulneris]|uniref:bifunctional RNase H/acid phosphatase n=1 Tax=Buchananella hordeovulneris TaxID=52770 RepID=UPI0026DC7347|nr:bifunctional RNase H/acid phosphatase [Buchananella hordeovulneris]MDO5081056.1 bifunctional RNase H/acid phosphatase [Buchananella hordeovulneris]
MSRRLLVHTDGGARGNPGPAGYGAVVYDAETGQVLATRARFLGEATNNVAEYEGLIAGLQAAHAIDPTATVTVRADSKLVVQHMSGAWKIKHPDMQALARRARAVLPPEQVHYEWVARADNQAADALANEAMDSQGESATDEWRQAPTETPAASPDPAPAANNDPAVRVSANNSVPVARPREASIWVGAGTRTTLVLVRHGVTPMTLAGEFSGGSEPGPDLSPEGYRQAEQTARFVARIGHDLWLDSPRADVVLASPMIRTQSTARVIAAALETGVENAEAFAEAHLGHWQGLTAAEIEQRWPGELQRWANEATVAPPGGGESLQDVQRRIRPALRRIVEEYAGRTVIIATHNVVLRAALGTVLRMEPRHWTTIRTFPASVSVIEHFADGRNLVSAIGIPPH